MDKDYLRLRKDGVVRCPLLLREIRGHFVREVRGDLVLRTGQLVR